MALSNHTAYARFASSYHRRQPQPPGQRALPGTPTTLKREPEAVVVPAVALKEGFSRRLARYEAALGLIAQHRDKFGAIVGLGAQRLVRDDDRRSRQCGRPNAIDDILRDGDAVERVLGVVRVVDRDCGPAQAGVRARAFERCQLAQRRRERRCLARRCRGSFLVASCGCAGRACFGAASAVGAVSAAIAASVTMAAGPQRRIATVDCAVVNRFTMPCPVGMRARVCVDRGSDRDIRNSQHHRRPIRSGGLSHLRLGHRLMHCTCLNSSSLPVNSANTARKRVVATCPQTRRRSVYRLISRHV